MSVVDGRVGWSIAEGKFRRKFIIHVVYRIYTGTIQDLYRHPHQRADRDMCWSACKTHMGTFDQTLTKFHL